ncbi:hypothetical protein PoB_006440700 [Plakobranchus ocellatus]|uniref:Uncharacterized protein n=1 Tax=Plakobranchus ocellatus TaxID=259542 RepID=A0AAV4D169_9GAST|nr:hypothetical protein PoB_006440700 [Plakobranchus ocellatus]
MGVITEQGMGAFHGQHCLWEKGRKIERDIDLWSRDGNLEAFLLDFDDGAAEHGGFELLHTETPAKSSSSNSKHFRKLMFQCEIKCRVFQDPVKIAKSYIFFTVACESALRSAGTLLSRVRAPLPAPWPDGGPESLRSPCCGLAIYKKLKLFLLPSNFPCITYHEYSLLQACPKKDSFPPCTVLKSCPLVGKKEKSSHMVSLQEEGKVTGVVMFRLQFGVLSFPCHAISFAYMKAKYKIRAKIMAPKMLCKYNIVHDRQSGIRFNKFMGQNFCKSRKSSRSLQLRRVIYSCEALSLTLTSLLEDRRTSHVCSADDFFERFPAGSTVALVAFSLGIT